MVFDVMLNWSESWCFCMTWMCSFVKEWDGEMEKICEFCTTLRPLVYCKADAAHLCLSCDARVHSANALSGRHFRTLLCQSCMNRPAYVRCMNHEMFICRNCDRTLHGFSSQHQKLLLKTYMGCPSFKDFAVLWGFELNLLDNCGNGDQFVSSSTCSADMNVSSGSSSRQRTVCFTDHHKLSVLFIRSLTRSTLSVFADKPTKRSSARQQWHSPTNHSFKKTPTHRSDTKSIPVTRQGTSWVPLNSIRHFTKARRGFRSGLPSVSWYKQGSSGNGHFDFTTMS